MDRNSKQLSNPFSTGGGGPHFEAHILASFVVLMLSGGYAPCLPCWPITKIKPQGKVDGFNTDDLIVFVKRSDKKEQRKLLGQVKHEIAFTRGNKELPEVFQAAWNDFNNSDIFKQNKDAIALITGPLSKVDFHNVHWLLNHARHTKDADEFYRHVERAKFSPPKAEEKLGVIQHHLQQANNNTALSQEELYSFLNHFYLLGYDLGDEVGVVLSLLHSHISQFNQQTPQWVWSRAVDLIQTWNKDAGTITPENLPEDLREAFKQPVVSHIPPELVNIRLELVKTDWRKHKYATDFALLLLLGTWNEKNEADVSIVTKITGQDYDVLAPKIQELLQVPDSPLSLHNGIWKISERIGLWEQLGSRIFDQHLETFKECAVSVLTERDPAFELPKEDRCAASIYGKTPQWSPALKKGLAEGLALLGSHPKVLSNCSQDKAELTAVLAVRDIFADADWVLWGSLNNLLPVLAEAAPDEFLNAVENALQVSPCPFDELFAQEYNDIVWGSDYIIGLLSSLEALAWDAEYLIPVCLRLGELASRDPGGTWSNRPSNSLSTILLPWKPHTIAPLVKRKAAIKTLCNELPQIGWQLVLDFLPNQHQMTWGSYKPLWRNPIPDDWKAGVTTKEYWEQVSFCAECAISLAGHDIDRLSELANLIGKIPQPSFDKFLGVLSSDAIIEVPEEKRLSIWNRLKRFIANNRCYSRAPWAWNNEQLEPIQIVTDKLTPSNPFNRYQRLFTDHDFEFYDNDEDWDIQKQKLTEYQKQALKEILQTGGIESIINFAQCGINSNQIGDILGQIDNEEIDAALLPDYLESERSDLSFFIRWYVFSRYSVKGWTWVDQVDKTEWSKSQIGCFLSYLPFSKETWVRAENWLGNAQKEYWLKTDAKNYNKDDKDLSVAIDELIKFERPYAALDCLHQMRQYNHPLNAEQCVRVLLAAASSTTEPSSLFNPYRTAELISLLQKSSEVDPDGLFNVEWAYLPLLDRHYGILPKTLENNLATKPEFFCQIIQRVYRSKNSDTEDKLSEKEKNIAENAYRLLETWRIPPGMQDDGRLDEKHFSNWLKQVKELCTESGHLERAFYHIGKILIHCPADADGLWINKTVADALNAKDVEEMRDGFSVARYNSRGGYTVDPTGKPERELAEKYRQQAEDVENAGFHRFATTLRDLAKSYERDAERIVKEHAVPQG
ncbi:ATP-binding protein [Candidatus Electrothrix gigas]